MKRWRNLLALVVGLSAVAAWLAACGGQPEISLSENTLDLGDVINGEVISREVSVRNNGQSDLAVAAVTTSCGCTQARLDRMTIPPGQSGTLQIEFDSGAHGPEETGSIRRQIFIASNDPQQPELTVELVANVLAADGS